MILSLLLQVESELKTGFDSVDSGPGSELCATEFDHHSSQPSRLLTL